jgi:hypothetical protein
MLLTGRKTTGIRPPLSRATSVVPSRLAKPFRSGLLQAAPSNWASAPPLEARAPAQLPQLILRDPKALYHQARMKRWKRMRLRTLSGLLPKWRSLQKPSSSLVQTKTKKLQEDHPGLDLSPKQLFNWTKVPCGAAFADVWLRLPGNPTI